MSALAKIQKDFCKSIRGHGDQEFLSHMTQTSLPKEELLDIHHNNIFSVHIRSLRNDFPMVFSMMGELMARPMAQGYVEANFPCTASLEEWCAGFSSFIQRYELAASWPYLAEIASYEWAKHKAYCSPEEPLLTAEDMKKFIEPGKEEVVFSFQKSCQLMAFSHPLEDIISSHQEGKAPPETQTSSYALLVKHEGFIKVFWLTPSLFVFVNRLKEGQDVDVAFAAAQVLDAEFNASQAFNFLLTNPLLHR
jgi:hypothetical protein